MTTMSHLSVFYLLLQQLTSTSSFLHPHHRPFSSSSSSSPHGRNHHHQPLRSSSSSATEGGGGGASLDFPQFDTTKIYPAFATTPQKYTNEYTFSLTNPDSYWLSRATEYLNWFTPPTKSLEGGFHHGDVRWFSDGTLNTAYNALDRHNPDKIALLFEGDDVPSGEEKVTQSWTYGELLREVSRVANAMVASGVRKGDVVTIYLPMTPLLPITMLACARIGAVHSVVFGGFSASALRMRIDASQSRFLVTGREGRRGGKVLDLESIWRESLQGIEEDVTAMVYDYYKDETKTWVATENKNEINLSALKDAQRPYCPPEHMSAEDPLFILYTSGSTGAPKGVVHTTGGYSLYAAMTTHRTFDLQPPSDIFACVADCGWITGHTYTTYGPLLNGATTVIFESVPTYPDPGRYWDMVDRLGINVFYTAPTAIRMLMRFGVSHPAKYSLESLRVLGSVGEPINPEAWNWYNENVGRGKCSIVDTYWQTETGGHIITPQAGVLPMKPGSCSLPFYGIEPVILDPTSGVELEGNDVQGILALKRPWPGMARTCLFDHERFLKTYLQPYPNYYTTGDAALRDASGFYWILGRTDDVLNVSGHRIGTAEVESALVSHAAVAQAAVVGLPHDVKGESICCFVTLTEEMTETLIAAGDERGEEEVLVGELRKEVRVQIGPFATPDLIILAEGLPMTRSGKIMRRVLRKIVRGDEDVGDTSTLADPGVVDVLKEKLQKL